MEEEWKIIEGYEKYMVSNLGKVLNTKTNKILKQSNDKDGYKVLGILNNLNRKKISVHRLVAIAFIPNPENKKYVNHKDNNPSNNRIDNLEWNTPKENVHHCIKQGRKPSGLNHWRNKLKELTEEDILEITNSNLPTRELMEKYNSSKSFINKLKRINKEEIKTSVKLTWDEVNQIRESKLKQRDLSKIYNISETTISQIINNKTWIK